MLLICSTSLPIRPLTILLINLFVNCLFIHFIASTWELILERSDAPFSVLELQGWLDIFPEFAALDAEELETCFFQGRVELGSQNFILVTGQVLES